MVLGAANGAAAQTTIIWDRQTAGIMDTSRRWRVITIATANANDISSDTPSPITSASPGVPNMMATPATAIAIAAHVRPVTGSRSTPPPTNPARTAPDTRGRERLGEQRVRDGVVLEGDNEAAGGDRGGGRHSDSGDADRAERSHHV